MTAKEYLMQVRNIDGVINAKLEEIEQLEIRVISLQSVKFGEKVKSSNTGDSVQKTIEKIVDMQSKIKSEIDKLVDLKVEVSSKISQLADNRYITVLIDYFINGMTFDEISNDENNHMKYSKRQIMRIYGYSLQAFEKLHSTFLKDVTKCH